MSAARSLQISPWRQAGWAVPYLLVQPADLGHGQLGADNGRSGVSTVWLKDIGGLEEASQVLPTSLRAIVSSIFVSTTSAMFRRALPGDSDGTADASVRPHFSNRLTSHRGAGRARCWQAVSSTVLTKPLPYDARALARDSRTTVTLICPG